VAEWDGRLRSPSFVRNFVPIRDALSLCLRDAGGTVLEFGSGTGQHIAHWARAFPAIKWVPSDIDSAHHASISAWGKALGCSNLAAPLFVDAATDWTNDPPVQALGILTAVLSCNVIHIAPWDVTQGIVEGAARVLAPGGGALILYGPFREGGNHTGPGNAGFDAALRDENPDWGVRDLDEVSALAAASGLGAAQINRMPSNNLLAAFVRP
jgi:SAM-dependent methyltransferase